ncbi:MAG: UDP-glucose 4-epimerase [Planctomycetaceae bacterium]|nr:UDP-glucose 4-epimerase [Planctomycetaceae bacterium]
MFKKVLVTGGAGFVASHIVDRLVNDNFEVTIIDNLTTGSEKNINKNACFYSVDIRNELDTLNDIFIKKRPDLLVHYAAQVNVVQSNERPIYDSQININGTINLVQFAQAHKVRKLIFASTGGALYGNCRQIPSPETSSFSPASAYAISKYAAEFYIRMMCEKSGVPWTIFRYSNVYGPRQRLASDGSVVPIFLQNAIESKKSTIYGNGNQTRDFIYIDDVVDSFMTVINENINGIFNIGTGIEVSINELHKMIGQLTNNKRRPIYRPERIGEVKRSALCIEKAMAVMDWKPKISLREGLSKILQANP